MPKREDELDLNDLPTINVAADSSSMANSQAASRSQAAKNAATGSSSATFSLSNKAFLAMLLLIGLSLAANIFFAVTINQLQQQSEQHISRTDALEKSLTSTDENMSQSSVAMQIKLRELSEKTEELWQQMDKLWASAWRRNQTEIADQGNAIKQQQTALASMQTLTQDIEKVNIQLKNEMIALQKESLLLEALISQVNDIETKQRENEVLKTQIQQLASQLSEVEDLSTDNAQWIESINVFRQQTNQSIARLEQQIQNKPATP